MKTTDKQRLDEITLRHLRTETPQRDDVGFLLDLVDLLQQEATDARRQATDTRREAEQAVAAAIRSLDVGGLELNAKLLGHPDTVALRRLGDGRYEYEYRVSPTETRVVAGETPTQLVLEALAALGQGSWHDLYTWQLRPAAANEGEGESR